MRVQRVAPSEDSGHNSLQMEASKVNQVQEARPLDLDVVADLERIVKRLGLDNGHAELDCVFANGSYVRGFIKQGPLTPNEMRDRDLAVKVSDSEIEVTMPRGADLHRER